MAELLEVLGEELRVAEEEIRSQHDLTEGPPRGCSGKWLARPGLAAALPVAILETDSNGLVVRANPAAAALFRVESCHLRGKPLAAMVEPADRRMLRTALTRATRRAGAEHVSLLVVPLHARAVAVNMAIIGTDPAGSGRLAGRPASGPDTDKAEAPTVRFAIAPQGQTQGDADAALLSALSLVATLSAVDGGLRSTLTQVAALAVDGIAPAVGASLTVGPPAEPSILVSTNGPAQTGDGDQFRAGAGPSWDAFATNTAVASATVHADERWPALGRGAADAASGTDAVTAVPMSSGTDVAGVLTLYGAGALAEPGMVRQATLFADAAAALLREHTAVARLRELEGELRAALTSRPIIDQAKGILMARDGVDADAAFAALATCSQRTNIKVYELAHQLVAEVSGRPARPAAAREAPQDAVDRILHSTDFHSVPVPRESTSDDSREPSPSAKTSPGRLRAGRHGRGCPSEDRQAARAPSRTT